MQKYTKIKTFRTTEKQYNTLQKMKFYNVDVSRFIREAISEKLQRDKKHFIKVEKKSNFEKQLDSAITKLDNLSLNKFV